MSAGLLILRLLMGFILFAHATQKSLGWLQGPGLKGSAAFFDSVGQRPGVVMVRVAAVCELTAGVLLTLGLITPFAAAVGAGTMLVAGTSQVARARILWNAAGGGEYPLFLAVVLLSLGFTGPGSWSLDRALFDPQPWFTGLIVLGVAAVAALPPAARSVRYLRPAPAPAAPVGQPASPGPVAS